MCGNEGDPQWVAVKDVFPWNVIKPLFVRSAPLSRPPPLSEPSWAACCLPQLIDVVYNVLFGLATMILAAYFSEGWFVVIWVVIIFGSPWCAAANVALLEPE